MTSSSAHKIKSIGSSRYRKSVATVFDVFLEVAAPEGEGDAFILWKYPEDFDDTKLLGPVAKFAFPCGSSGKDTETVQLFSFVLTQENSFYTFGFCRYTPRTNTCLCVVSGLPWTNFFYKLLDHYASVVNNNGTEEECEALLVRAYHQEVPHPGETFILESSLGRNKLEFQCPDFSRLPTIRDNRNLMDYYNCIREEHMIAVFCSLLKERRVILTGKKLGQLSHCVIAAQSLIYPLFWQHVFIPILPRQFLDYVSAPMPILVGVPSSVFEEARRQIDFNEVVVLNIDQDHFSSPFDDGLPRDALRALKNNLHHSNHMLGDGLARSFLRAMVVLLGAYRKGLERNKDTGKLSFDIEKFAADHKSQTMRNYLLELQSAQIFREFIEDRIGKIESSTEEEYYDEFEEEVKMTDFAQFYGKHHRSNLAGPESLQQAYFSVVKPVLQVRDRGLDVISGFQERVSKLAKEAPTALKPGFSPPVVRASNFQKPLDAATNLVRERLPRIGRTRLDASESTENADMRGPYIGAFDDISKSPDIEIGTPALDSPSQDGISIASLEEPGKNSTSKSLVDLLDLDKPANQGPQTTTASTNQHLGRVDSLPNFHHSHSAADLLSHNVRLDNKPRLPISPLVSSRNIPSSPANLSGIAQRPLKPPTAVPPKAPSTPKNDLIDLGFGASLDDSVFDPLAKKPGAIPGPGAISIMTATGPVAHAAVSPSRPPKPAHLRGNPIAAGPKQPEPKSSTDLLLDIFGGGATVGQKPASQNRDTRSSQGQSAMPGGGAVQSFGQWEKFE